MDIVGLCGKAWEATRWFLEKRKESRDIFIVKAMSNAHRAKLGFAIGEDGPLNSHEIEGLIMFAQLVAAGCYTGDSCYIEPGLSLNKRRHMRAS